MKLISLLLAFIMAFFVSVPQKPQRVVPEYAGDYLDLANAWAQEYPDEVRFALIDFDVALGVPVLVIDRPGFSVSLYYWDGSGNVTLAYDWGYGAFGISGYEYIPGCGVIRVFDADLAGMVVYEDYLELRWDGEAYCFEDFHPERLEMRHYLDKNGNDFPDEDEPYLEEPLYYYGGQQITKEQYIQYQVHGDYQWIDGRMTLDELKDALY